MDILTKSKGLFFSENKRIASLNLHILGCGHNLQKSREMTRAKRTLNCYACVVFWAGEGFFESRHKKRSELAPGDTFFLFPGEWHRYGPRTPKRWREFWFLLDGPVMDFWTGRKLLSPEKPLLKMGPDPSFLALLENGIRCGFSENSHDLPRLPSLVFEILGKILDPEDLKERQQGPPAFQNIFHQVNQDPVKPWNFQKLARSQGISYSLVRKLFVKHTGLAPQQFLVKRRMEWASGLLADGTPVAQTAYQIGMEDPFHFSRVFKRHIGKSPSRYAKSFKDWKSDIL